MALTKQELTELFGDVTYEKETGQTYNAWNTSKNPDFKKGAVFAGNLMEKRESVGPNNSKMYIIENRDHEIWALWGSTLIDQRMANKEIGQFIVIEYLGKEKGKRGTEYHNYDFYFEKNSL